MMGIDNSKTVRFISDLGEYKQALYLIKYIAYCFYEILTHI